MTLIGKRGVGFKQFLELEWILSNELRQKLLSIDLFVFSGNYFALISEILFLPLLIIPKTRKIAFILYAPLGLQLLLPFNIFLIGYFAAVYVICIASFVFAKDPIKQYNFKSIYFIPGIWLIVLFGFAFTLTAWCIKEKKNNTLTKANYKDTAIKYHYALADIKEKNLTIVSELNRIFSMNELYNPYEFINKRWLRRGPIALFSGAHTVGLYAYKVEYFDSLGVKQKSINFFQENGGRGDIDKEFMQLNPFQGSMYSYADLVYHMHAVDSVVFFSLMKSKYNRIIDPIIKYIDSKVEHNYTSVCISIKSLGKDCPDNNTFWKKFIEVKGDSLEIHVIDVKSCNQARNPYLKNFRIIQ